MQNENQIKLLRAVSAEFGSALAEESKRLEGLLEQRVTGIQDNQAERLDDLEKRLTDVTDKQVQLSALEYGLDDVEAGIGQLKELIEKLPEPFDPESLDTESLASKMVSGTALPEYLDTLNERVTAASDRVQKELSTRLDSLRDDAASWITDLKELIDQEKEVEIDITKLLDALGESDEFTGSVTDHVDDLFSGYIEREKIRLMELTVDHYDKVMDNAENLVKAYLDSLPVPENGKDGADGRDGVDGAGIDSMLWEKDEIYLAGQTVQAYHGQHYRAKCNTNKQPGKSDDWERVGTSGLRFIGLRPKDDSELQEGDFYIDKGSCFIVSGGRPRMMVQKGKDADEVAIVTQILKSEAFHDRITESMLPRMKVRADEIVATEISGLDLLIVVAKGDGGTETHSVNLSEMVSHITNEIKQFWIEQITPPDDVSAPIKWYRGLFDAGVRYSVGDMVKIGRSTYLMVQQAPAGTVSEPYWVKIGGGGGGAIGTGRPAAAASPFHVIANAALLPATGAGDGDTYFVFDDQLLRIWDATKGAWTTPYATAHVYANEAAAHTGQGVSGEIRFASSEGTIWVWDDIRVNWLFAGGSAKFVADEASRLAVTPRQDGIFLYQQDTKKVYMSDGGSWIATDDVIVVADSAALAKVDTRTITNGKVAYQVDTHELWVYNNGLWLIAGGSSGVEKVSDEAALHAASAPAAPGPAGDSLPGDIYYQEDTDQLWVRNDTPAAGNATNWSAVGSGSVRRAADVTALNAIADADLDEGQVVYVDDLDGAGTFGLLRRNATARTNTLADFQVILPSAATIPIQFVDKTADLPLMPVVGVTYVVRYDDAGNPYEAEYVWDAAGGPLTGGTPAQPPAGGVPAGYIMSMAVAPVAGGFTISHDLQGSALAGNLHVHLDVVDTLGTARIDFDLLAGQDEAALQAALINALTTHAFGFTATAVDPNTVNLGATAHGGNVSGVTVTLTGPASQPPGYVPAVPATAAGGWVQTDQRVRVKPRQANPDHGDPRRNGDLQVTTEANHAELKVYDEAAGAWLKLFSEDEIKEWVASSSLFQGTVNVIPTAGSAGLAELPDPDPSNRGAYWTWVGPPNYEVAAGLTDPAANEIQWTPDPLPGTAGGAVDGTIQVQGGGAVGTARDIVFRIDIDSGGTKVVRSILVSLAAADTADDIANKLVAIAAAGTLGITVANNGGGSITVTPPPTATIDAIQYVPDGQTPGIGGDLAGETLQVGDWIQSNGVNWLHVASDLLSKLRGDRLYGLEPWQDSNWEKGALVYFANHIYKSTAAVQTGDAPPSVPANPVTISATSFDGTKNTAGDVSNWVAANAPNPGNAQKWVYSLAAGNVVLPSGSVIPVNAGDAVLNLGNPGLGTEGFANVGPVTLPAIVPAHDVSPTINVGPITTQGEMIGLPPPSAVNAGTWAVVTAPVNPPAAAGGAVLAAGSTIMVLEDASQGQAGYSINRLIGGVPLVNASNVTHPTSPGAVALLLNNAALDALCQSSIANFAAGEWMPVLYPPPYVVMPAGPGTPARGNLDTIMATAKQGDAIGIVAADSIAGTITYTLIPDGGVKTNPEFIGLGSGVTQLGGNVPPQPPAPVTVPDRQPPPSTAPSFTYTPTSSGSKWVEIELESGIISISDDTKLPVVPPSEDTLIFIANSARMGNQPALVRWDTAQNDYIDIVARAEHPIVVYPSVAVMRAAAPSLPNALGFAAQERQWGEWIGPTGPGSKGQWVVDEYWSTVRGNMGWQPRVYQADAIVYLRTTNSFYRATQRVPETIAAPNQASAAAYWQQIGSAAGGGGVAATRVFFGKGDFDASDTSTANNWGMPAATFPQNVQPLDGDAYFDRASGTIVKFTVIPNPPTNQITGRLDTATATKIGELSIGVVAGKVDVLTFNEDGVAAGRAKNDYYTLQLPANFQVTAEASAAAVTWSGPLEYGSGIAGAALGKTIVITQTGGAAIPVGTGTPMDGHFFAQGTGFIYTNLPWLNGDNPTTGETYYDGWLVVPAVNNGQSYNANPFITISNGGPLDGLTFEAGDYAIIWTADRTADQDGWAVIGLVAGTTVYDWVLGTPNPRPQDDDITGTIQWGTKRNFQYIVPPLPDAASHRRVVLQGITEGTNTYKVVMADTDPTGSTYEFYVSYSSGGEQMISPIIVNSHNSQIEQIGVHSDTTRHNKVVVDFLDGAVGKTYDISIEVQHGSIDSVVSLPNELNSAKPSGSQKIDGKTNYPTDELTQFLKAMTGDSSAAVAVPGRDPGANMGSANISLEGGKIYRLSGYYVSVGGYAPLVSLFHDGSSSNKLRVADAEEWSNVIVYGNNATAQMTSPYMGGADGWFGCINNTKGTHQSKPFHVELMLDLRNPNKIIFKMRGQGRTSNGDSNKTQIGETYIQWAVNPAHSPTGYGFYLSGWTDDSSYQWFMFKDN